MSKSARQERLLDEHRSHVLQRRRIHQPVPRRGPSQYDGRLAPGLARGHPPEYRGLLADAVNRSKNGDVVMNVFESLVREQGITVVMVTHDPSLTSRTTRNIIIADGELINETVAKSLPWLRHRHMMEFTKLIETQNYPAKTTIISRDAHVEYFFMIHKGEVEVVLQDRKNEETIISRLGPGEFFGEAELMRGGKSIACVRASKNPFTEAKSRSISWIRM